MESRAGSRGPKPGLIEQKKDAGYQLWGFLVIRGWARDEGLIQRPGFTWIDILQATKERALGLSGRPQMWGQRRRGGYGHCKLSTLIFQRGSDSYALLYHCYFRKRRWRRIGATNMLLLLLVFKGNLTKMRNKVNGLFVFIWEEHPLELLYCC